MTKPKKYAGEPAVLYLCDKKKCRPSSKKKGCTHPICKHTTDVKHATNFKFEHNCYVEKERNEENDV